MKFVMGLDIGTTGCKATIFNKCGQVCIQAYREYPIKKYDGMIDPDIIWSETQKAIKECTKTYSEIEAICTTSFGESVVLVDEEHKVLAKSFLYTNDNAKPEWNLLEQRIGRERIAEITGHVSHSMYTINRLMWIRRYEEAIYSKVHKFLFFASFIAMRLGAEMVAEDTLAARSMAYDVVNKSWSKEILQAAGIENNKMPKIVTAGEMLGYVSEDNQKTLGLTNNVKLIAGGHDQPCVALGMGVMEKGQSVYGLGTVECLSVVLNSFMQSGLMQEKQLVCSPHVIPGKYLTYGVLYSGGNVLRDIRNHFYKQEFIDAEEMSKDVYDLMMEEMPSENSELLFVPHLVGAGTPLMNPSAKGILAGIHLSTTKGEIVKAAIQGLAFDMRLNIENMQECGIPVQQIFAAGGGAKSERALQVRANAMNQKLFQPDDVQAGTRGVYMIAAVALGWYKDYIEAHKQLALSGQYIIPNDIEAAKDKKLFDKFLILYQASKLLYEGE